MVEEKARARRRDEKKRAKERALRRLALRIKIMRMWSLLPSDITRSAGKLARTPTPCSCLLCGNPRKYRKGADRETLAETKARMDEKDGVGVWMGAEMATRPLLRLALGRDRGAPAA